MQKPPLPSALVLGLLALLAVPTPARAEVYTYGAFASGAIENSSVRSMRNTDPPPLYVSCYFGPGTCYYLGTETLSGNWPATSINFGPVTGAAGTVSNIYGTSTASASLLSGDLSAHADTSVPGSSPSGSPAYTYAGYFTQVTFHGAQSGSTGQVSIGGSLAYAGNFTAAAALFMTLGAPVNTMAGAFPYTTIAQCDLNQVPSCGSGGEAWSLTQQFTIQNDVPYTLLAGLYVTVAGQGQPGSVTITDPISFDLPGGVSFTADGGFLSAIPEPATLALLSPALLSLAAARRARAMLPGTIGPLA